MPAGVPALTKAVRLGTLGRLPDVPVTMPWADATAHVDARLSGLLPSVEYPPRRLHEAMRYAVLGGGKRLRPALCLAASVAAGGDQAAALDAACAVELVHCFSLVHDDLPAIDDDDLRRGRPTLHRAFDEATAILAGDALFALAFQVLAESPGPQERLAELARASGTNGLVGGEVLDIEAEGEARSLDEVRRIHERKTGALIACACALGGMSAGVTPAAVDALREFGSRVGLAFQIIDDVLDVTATTEQLGKSSGADRRREKATYPSLIGVPASQDKAQELLASASQLLAPLSGSPQPLLEIARRCVERTR